MHCDDMKIYDILCAARRNTIWSGQGQNSTTTSMHIGTTLHLIEVALSILDQRITTKPTK